MKRLYIFTLCSVAMAACIFVFKQRDPITISMGKGLVIPGQWLVVRQEAKTPTADVRPADQTFLTYPEWFLVFSPEEQAHYFKHHTATGFPFMSHTRQIWKSYRIVHDQIRDHFPTNTGYHFMIWVIGSSASVEYSIKAWYETVIGRVTDTGVPLTDEDKFNATFTQEYVDFIKDRPWYEFDFKSRLITLWNTVPFFGDHVLRKLERRYILTSELLVKWGYGKLIGLGTKQVYDEALPTTAVVLNNDSLVYLPRYDRFAEAASSLAEKGFTYKEIAGNNSAILLTVLLSEHENLSWGQYPVKTVFIQPLAAEPGIRRVALATPVTSLAGVLLELKKKGLKPEHVFDY